MSKSSWQVVALAALLTVFPAGAQVFSPRVLVKGQVDSSNLQAFVQGIYSQAGAATPRQKAEAIWRFFLTDGRFVAPGFWYHIAGWAYEEPQGEVLDPLKLLNSYGFGLCYQIAPLLESLYKAGGFEDARVWFLTGHTVTEVFYDGAYHYYDADMLGYTTVGPGEPRNSEVASVSQIARDGNILLSKLKSPTEVDPAKVDQPWYPADLREGAIGDLVSAFTSTSDNWLYAFTRYPQAHGMDFVLRPGERLTRFFYPESDDLYYLPFKNDGKSLEEFPREIPEFKVRTSDGPRSQKDDRRWATGRLDYSPVLSDKKSYYTGAGDAASENLRFPDSTRGRKYLGREDPNLPSRAVFEMNSAYVLIDAALTLNVKLQEKAQSVAAEISADGGRSWQKMASLEGPHNGRWECRPGEMARGSHGITTIVSGKYGYLIRLSLAGPGSQEGIQIRDIRISSNFQVNPRTLPALSPGHNDIAYQPGSAYLRASIPIQADKFASESFQNDSLRYIAEDGQGIIWPDAGKTGEVIYELSAPDGSVLSGFDAGARFLDLKEGLAPDKFTAEVRKTSLARPDSQSDTAREASLSWSVSPTGGFLPLWQYNPTPGWKDGLPVKQTLRWPEVDRQIRSLPVDTRKVYVRYSLKGIGMDSPRLAAICPRPDSPSRLEITHRWSADGREKEHVERIHDSRSARRYRIDIPTAGKITNRAVIFFCPPPGKN
jgi:hypothetical protein